MDRSGRPQEARNRYFRHRHAVQAPFEACLHIRLVVIVPSRDKDDVAPASVLCDVRGFGDELPEVAPRAMLALHLVACDVPIAIIAVTPIVICEVPTVPPDHTEAARPQVLEIQRVVATLQRACIDLGFRFCWHCGDLVAEPLQIEVELINPRHPEDVARSNHVEPHISFGRYRRTGLLYILRRGEKWGLRELLGAVAGTLERTSRWPAAPILHTPSIARIVFELEAIECRVA
mmetsp:Transcript_127315/g.284642  ORF Transcript_127315/g.284642 Transcript_127315/m.284642 type:complete len:233 (+) Transcript_127315:365-1063(+)